MTTEILHPQFVLKTRAPPSSGAWHPAAASTACVERPLRCRDLLCLYSGFLRPLAAAAGRRGQWLIPRVVIFFQIGLYFPPSLSFHTGTCLKQNDEKM